MSKRDSIRNYRITILNKMIKQLTQEREKYEETSLIYKDLTLRITDLQDELDILKGYK